MIIYESKLEGTQNQYEKLDAAIRTGRFVRNSIIRAWMDNQIKSRNEAYAYCKTLADHPEFPWAKQLNSQARQAHVERAWASIERFYRNCKAKVPGKKGFPKFRKSQVRDSVEYKVTGWKLSEDRRHLTFTDGFQAGTFKLWGSRNLHFSQLNQIKRVRVVRRHDGYYAQFLIDHKREEKKELTGRQIGLDVGLNHFYTDSFGEKIDNPRFLRKDERRIKKLQRRLSKTQKGSKKRVQARNKLGRAHLKVSRRRNDWVCKLAQRVIRFNDLVAIENLKVRNMIKNHYLAKSISDAAWYRFREWLEYFGVVYGVPVIAVNPSYTSQNCSNCGQKVVKTLSTRTHKCPHCGYIADRDENAAINILKFAFKQSATTVGRTECEVSGEIPLCLVLEAEKSKGTPRKRKPK
ncbi:MAG: transposase [Microcoleus sp. PH2017_10_PVI_O_A]|uniref:RNA-guided endonuclease InsQ/TnpB family protein n=1 Tax=unclassified Microcoleus TaxID=2642155 RepID=UPI001D25883F|nr:MULTISPECIES: transposase [unclassified Microcoleus]TAE85123.1 MAG: transposase [Oscillatoriales cyanobacterium]MCC3405283.1 transposase [Microcoleus sp. PH2017_10_PVI_O_A]MCC3458867.1 transposase [Microcoleus sp. PH2017_11_PCY_U_A]MCC3477088.1 transposase [Microcoleus sp. PH2017_12_PCY_D_A]MCC3528301.1 transposase [Microcoleus sp. PH2017_21_RUC_O_A]